METEQKAKEIYEYLREYLFKDVKVRLKHKKEYIKDICFLIDTD